MLLNEDERSRSTGLRQRVRQVLAEGKDEEKEDGKKRLVAFLLVALAACGPDPGPDFRRDAFPARSGGASAPARTVGRAGDARPERPQPNLVFILADDLGKELLPLYGAGADIATPHLDRLAAEGVAFDNAYAGSLCLCARVELLSGQYPFRSGVAGFAGHPQTFVNPKYVPSFPRLLRDAGYATVLGGKWHGFPRSGQGLRTFGFEEWMVTPWGAAADDVRIFTHDGVQRRRPDEFSPDRVADFLVDFIGRRADRPFFVYWPMHLVHGPLVATPLAPDAASDRARLIAMTEYVDHLVGRLLAALDAAGRRDDTIVFFASDNGSQAIPAAGDADGLAAGGKGTLRETGINVPFVVSGGPVAARGRSEALTDFTDVLPTLVELAGADPPSGHSLDGRSLAPWLLGEAARPPRRWIASALAAAPLREVDGRLRWAADRFGIAVRNRDFKLLEQRDGRRSSRALFDLRRDPSESRDLWDSAEPEAAAARETLAAARGTLPAGVAPVRYDPLDARLFSHWPFDAPRGGFVFPDVAGGYDARTETRAGGGAGRFGGGLAAPARAPHFGDFFEPGRETFAYPMNEGAGGNSLAETGFALSAWVRLPEGAREDRRLLRYAGADGDLLDWSVTADGALVLKLGVAGERAGLGAPETVPRDGTWTHVAAVWEGGSPAPGGGWWETILRRLKGGDDACGAARLYVDGRMAAEECLGRGLAPHAAAALRIAEREREGGPGGPPEDAETAWLDDVAVWRRVLGTPEIAALHGLGERFGYDASAVDTLLNAPPDGTVLIGGRRWRRTAAPAARAGEPAVRELPSGAIELRIGDRFVLRADPGGRGAR